MPFLFMKYKILAHSFATISNWTPTYTLTLMKAAVSLRGATGTHAQAREDPYNTEEPPRCCPQFYFSKSR